ncbi:2'-5' RNA ligase [Clostridium aestuarii]|uniref:2'-5' RNA ligase n=1 Tax=Clostridium aestuarii TaxID=338193 RepID=A0ABT4D1X4_9CLOT|nr:2'-5' RNA ligase [Clostridium aestuarii]MCY6485254.1 2'-5' RNA ligase [Clostridium aestuarii]
MKYRLVALFDDESSKHLQTTQRNLCKRYRIYKSNQQLHIPIQTVIDPDIEKFDKIITDTLGPYKKFKVQIKKDIYLDKFSKYVNLRVQNKGYINRIARNISDTLILSGFNIKNNYNDLHIYLANSNYALRKSLNNLSSVALTTKNNNIDFYFAKVNKLELWKLLNNKKEVLIKTYSLRDY